MTTRKDEENKDALDEVDALDAQKVKVVDKNKNLKDISAMLDERSAEIDEIKSRYQTKIEVEDKLEADGGSDWSGYMLGLNLLISVLVCTVIGYYTDKFFQTGGFLVVLFVFIGFSAGMWQLWKGLNKED
tara:strand:- start:10630 stop:11019 length:390 start_codon:yes stop_codon:yes gene_type:complete